MSAPNRNVSRIGSLTVAAGGLLVASWLLHACGGDGQTGSNEPSINATPQPAGGDTDGGQASTEPVRYDPAVIEDPDVRELLDERIAAVERSPQSASAHQMLALAYESNDQFKLAAESYERSQALSPRGSLSNHIHLALCYEQDGLMEDALAELEAGLALAGPSAEIADQVCVRFNLGVAYLDRGEYDKARPLFEWILNHPELHQYQDFRGPAQLAIAEILLEEEQPAEARKLIQLALKVRPDDAFAMFLLGRALSDLGQTTQAELWLQKGSGAQRMPYGNSLTSAAADMAVSKSKRLQSVNDLAALRDEASNRKALTLLRALQERYPDDAVVLNNLAAILMRVNEFQEALDVLMKIIEADETEFPAWYNVSHLHITIGELYRTQNQDLDTAFMHYRQALLAAENAVLHGPQVAEMHLQLGRARMINQQVEDAILALRKALELGSEDTAIYFNLAKMERHQFSLEKAVQTMNDGVARNPTWVDGRLHLARLLLEMGDHGSAVKQHVELQRLAPDDQRVRNLGNALGR